MECPPSARQELAKKHLGEHTTSIHDSGVRTGALMRPRRRAASELLRLIEVLVLNEVVEDGGTGQRSGGENAAARSARARSACARSALARVADRLGSLSPPCTSTSVLMCDLVVLHGTTGAGAPMSCFSP